MTIVRGLAPFVRGLAVVGVLGSRAASAGAAPPVGPRPRTRTFRRAKLPQVVAKPRGRAGAAAERVATTARAARPNRARAAADAAAGSQVGAPTSGLRLRCSRSSA